MAKMTKQEKIIQFLIADKSDNGMGLKEEHCRSGKYRMFAGKDSKGPIYIFTGRNGAVRFNRKPAASGSYSLTDSPHFNKLMEEFFNA